VRIDDEPAPLTPVPRRSWAGRKAELAAGAVVVVLVVAIVGVVIANREESASVDTDASPTELLDRAADHLADAGTVRFEIAGDLDVTPEAGEMVLDELAVRAGIGGDGEEEIGTGSRFGVDFEVTDGPLPPELGPSRLDHVEVDGETWTRVDGGDWEQAGMPDDVLVDLPRVDAPDQILDLARERGERLEVAETTAVDGVDAHRVSLRLSASDVGIDLADPDAGAGAGAVPPARVDVYVAAGDGRLLRIDIGVEGVAPDPVPASIRFDVRTTYRDHGDPVTVEPPG
jgi:hypothetical protein